jgi:hypothetical protein
MRFSRNGLVEEAEKGTPDGLIAIVIPTIGRSSLTALLVELDAQYRTVPAELLEVLVVDDRKDPSAELELPRMSKLSQILRVIKSGGRGAAAARNLGWRDSQSSWISFVDDDVRPGKGWLNSLMNEVRSASASVGGIQGMLSSEAAPCERPSEWERRVASLGAGHWITADMAYRRTALDAVGGFDERLKVLREDSEVAVRVRKRGYALVRGQRRSFHAVLVPDRWVSIRHQKGNADDSLMRRVYGRRWHDIAEAPRGRRRRHALIVACLGGALISAPFAGRLATISGVTSLALLAEFVISRALLSSRKPAELKLIAATSLCIPFCAVYHWLRGAWTHRNAQPWGSDEAKFLKTSTQTSCNI